MRFGSTNERTMADAEDAPPVIEDPTSPAMPNVESLADVQGLTAEDIGDMPGAGEGMMEPIAMPARDDATGDGTGAPNAQPESPPPGDVGRPGPEAAVPPVESGYIRLRLRVEGGNVSVVGVRSIPGPLTTERTLQGELVYEVSRALESLATGTVPDVGVMRSFPATEGLPEQRVHHITETPSFEFNVRLPRDRLSRDTMPTTEIAIYRVKGGVLPRRLTEQPLSVQLDRELREVARLRGIDVGVLPGDVREQLDQAMPLSAEESAAEQPPDTAPPSQ